MIEKINEEAEMVTIYYFVNNFVFHGKVKARKIVDDSKGIIIDQLGEKIKVSYKYIEE